MDGATLTAALRLMLPFQGEDCEDGEEDLLVYGLLQCVDEKK